MAEEFKQNEEVTNKLAASIEEIATSTQTVYEAVEQVAKSASALAKAGQESVEQAKFPSRILLARPTFWASTPPSRQPVPASRAEASLSWLRK